MAKYTKPKSTSLIVNPYVYWVKRLNKFILIFSIFAGLSILFFNFYIGISVMTVGLITGVALLPFVIRNCNCYVVFDKKRVSLTRFYNSMNQTTYKSLITYNWEDVYITLVGPVRKIAEDENCYMAYFGKQYFMPNDLRSRAARKNSFFMMVNYQRLMCFLQHSKKPITVILKSKVERDIILFRCQNQNVFIDKLTQISEKNYPITMDNFTNISKRAIIAYSICCLENALKYYEHSGEGWKVLLSNLWKITQIDDEDKTGLENWLGIIDLLPNSIVKPYNSYQKSCGRFNKDKVLARISGSEYNAIIDSYETFHSVIGELCEGVFNLAVASVSEFFYDMAYNTIFTLQEEILEVMYRNQIPLPDVEQFVQYPLVMPMNQQAAYCLGPVFNGIQYSKFVSGKDNAE